MRRTTLTTLYSTGIRRAELCHLKVSDIDSKRMLIRVRQGKGGRDREGSVEPEAVGDPSRVLALEEAEAYLFPGTVSNWRADAPITPKVVGRRGGGC